MCPITVSPCPSSSEALVNGLPDGGNEVLFGGAEHVPFGIYQKILIADGGRGAGAEDESLLLQHILRDGSGPHEAAGNLPEQIEPVAAVVDIDPPGGIFHLGGGGEGRCSHRRFAAVALQNFNEAAETVVGNFP